MGRWLEHRLGQFVDRSQEIGRFRAVLDAQRDERIVTVWGGEATGKSSLLIRFAAELNQRQIAAAHVDWKGSRNYDHLAFMRSVRDQLCSAHGVQHFARFTDLVNFFTKPDYKLTLDMPTSVNIFNEASLSNTTVGPVTGVVIEDLKIVMPRNDLAISPGELVVKLTAAFAADLAALAADVRLALLLDSVEKIDETTRDWLWDELLPLLLEGDLGEIVVVLCGQQPPPKGEWVPFVLDLELPPLGIADIKEYLLLRKAANDAEVAGMARLLKAMTEGRAGAVAEAVDVFLRDMKNQAEGG